MPVSDQQMNRILSKISDTIPSDCSIGRKIQRASILPGTALNATEFGVSNYEAYRNDIDFVNSFTEEVLKDEAAYFRSKYGDDVYNYLKEQRNQYVVQQRKIDRAETCKTCPFDASRCNVKDASGNSTCDASGNRKLIDFLQSQLPIQNPDTTYKKIEYRDEAHETLSNMNRMITHLYFIVLAIMFIFLFATQRLLLKERFILYLFLVLLPYIFPYFFDLLKKLYQYMFPASPTHGPKNAFLDNRANLIESYNT